MVRCSEGTLRHEERIYFERLACLACITSRASVVAATAVVTSRSSWYEGQHFSLSAMIRVRSRSESVAAVGSTGDRRRWWRIGAALLFVVTCIAGCSYQCLKILILYFEYPTTNRIASLPVGEESFQSPVLILCSRYKDHMTQGKMSNKTTIRDILEHTPAPESLPQTCWWRTEAGYERRDGLNCSNAFAFDKFYTQASVCYSVQQIQGQRLFKTQDLASHIRCPFEVYSIRVSRNLSDGFVAILPMISGGEGAVPAHLLTYLSRPFASLLHLRQESGKPILATVLRLSFKVSRVHLLEKPYDTACYREEDPFQALERKRECVIDSLAHSLNRTPFAETIAEKLPYPHISELEWSDEGTREEVQRVTRACHARHASRTPCSTSYTSTLIDLTNNSSSKGSLLVDVLSPRESAQERISEARMSLIEFLTYVSSCLSTWFGFPILSFSPFAAALPRFGVGGHRSGGWFTASLQRMHDSIIDHETLKTIL